MKNIIIISIVFSCIVGCNSVKKETGNLQQFLLNQFNEYSSGSHLLDFNKDLIPNDISWEYKTDKDGFGVTVIGDYYKEINDFISELYITQGKIDNDNTMIIYCLEKQKLRVQCSFYIFENKPFVSINAIKNEAFQRSIAK